MLTGREIIGNFMYPRHAPLQLLRLAGSRQLDLEGFPMRSHPLADLKPAMDEAASPGAPLVVLRP